MNTNKVKTNNRHVIKETILLVFTVVSAVAASIAAYYSIKSDKDNQPSQIGLEYYVSYEPINVDSINVFVNLITPYFGQAFLGNYNSAKYPLNGLPEIKNNSSKSINNFRLDVYINYEYLELDEKNISADYEIIDHQPSSYRIHLRNKYDVLNAKSSAPIPLASLSIPENIPLHYKDSLLVPFDYSDLAFRYIITYDGISEPIAYSVYYIMYHDKEANWSVSDEHVEDFLDMCYKDGAFNYSSTIVSILDKSPTIVHPPQRLLYYEFVQFKKEFIESRK